MARFIRSQTLTLLEKLNELDADEQADICQNRFTTTLMSFTALPRAFR